MNEEREFYERIAEVFAAPRLRPPRVWLHRGHPEFYVSID